MKRIALILALGVASQLALAGQCHHYSIWHYKYPQPKCQVAKDRSWFVEIIALPEDIARQQAIDVLKELLK